jgi:hypothetical protein
MNIIYAILVVLFIVATKVADFLHAAWVAFVSFGSAFISVTLTGTKSTDVQEALDMHR